MSENPVPQPHQAVQAKFGRTLTDVGVLLEYLGQLSDGRLQAHFDDTRQNIAQVVPRRTAPPCRTYAHFLNRLSVIAVAVRKGAGVDQLQALGVPEPQNTNALENDQGLDNISFLYWSRDFLAGVAAPATVESIEITKAYIRERIRSFALLRWFHCALQSWKRRQDALPDHESDPCDESKRRRNVAGRLARQVCWLEWVGIVMTFLTLAVSVYALSGRLILEQQQSARDAYATLTQEIQTTLKDSQLPVWSGSFSDLCPPGSQAATQVASNGGTFSQASTLTAVSIELARLCWKWNAANRTAFAANLHLQSWASVVTRHPVRLSVLFGVVSGTIQEVSQLMTEEGLLEHFSALSGTQATG
jgi:hypothetical protein